MRRIFKRLHRRVVAVLLCLAVTDPVTLAHTLGEVPIGGSLGEATLQGLNGPSVNLRAFRGRSLIINVWASWCGPCRQEMASLERLAWRGENESFAIIGISTDDSAEQAQRFLKNTNATISHFIDHGLEMENMLGATKLPLTVLVDANGRVLEKIYGARQWDGPEALQLIDRVFRQKVQHVDMSWHIENQNNYTLLEYLWTPCRRGRPECP